MTFIKNRLSHARMQSITTVASEPLSLSSTPSSPSASLFDSKTKWASTLADNLTRGTKPPESGEPYVLLPTQFFSLHYHLQFNPAPPYESNLSKKTSGPSSISGSGAKCNCNCGTWTMFCLPPHLGGCGHRYVQDVLYCGRTIDESQPERALSTVCPGIDPSRIIKCAGYMMGLCPTCRRDAAVVQTYNKFMTPFFVQKGLDPYQMFDAEARSAAAWKSHRLAFSKWISEQREQNLLE